MLFRQHFNDPTKNNNYTELILVNYYLTIELWMYLFSNCMSKATYKR